MQEQHLITWSALSPEIWVIGVGLTEFTTPSWPLNFLMVRPVLTSHRKTCLSPPHDANLRRVSSIDCAQVAFYDNPPISHDNQPGYFLALVGNGSRHGQS